MKYISITFDDGRADNYYYAAPILNKYGLPATMFITTGYVDGTWEKPTGSWKSTDGAVSIEQVLELQQQGWEIGLHGDKHITELEDWITAISKFEMWGIKANSIPFSVPNSGNVDDEIVKIISSDKCKRISFIRHGRGTDTKKLSNRFLFLMYSFLGSQLSYNVFNTPSCNDLHKMNVYHLNSVVIRRNDSPRMILRFIDSMPDDSWCILMLHSIWGESDPLYCADQWTWSESALEAFAEAISNKRDRGQVRVISMHEMEGIHYGCDSKQGDNLEH